MRCAAVYLNKRFQLAFEVAVACSQCQNVVVSSLTPPTLHNPHKASPRCAKSLKS